MEEGIYSSEGFPFPLTLISISSYSGMSRPCAGDKLRKFQIKHTIIVQYHYYH